MEFFLLELAFVFSLVLFFMPKKFVFWVFLLIDVLFTLVSSFIAVNVFMSDKVFDVALNFSFWEVNPHLVVDNLSAFFILVINFTSLMGALYAYGYLKPYFDKKNGVELSWHFFNFLLLHFSMTLLPMVREGLLFLTLWEVMSISSFFLVIFHSEKVSVIKTGVNYLIQMHIGFLFLLASFIYIHLVGGGAFGFDGFGAYFSGHNPLILFVLLFIGFGIKAGYIPLHSWLPHAHPAGPSHVSGVMSGVMIKLGIYGILRTLTYIHSDLFSIGVIILLAGIVSGVLGVVYAIIQHDIKKLLAYHSIENIGIITIGIGLGVIGIALHLKFLVFLGFLGGVWHVLNHSLFKSLLFFASGSVYKKTHTRNIEKLGGLIKGMPVTAVLFLIGAVAISGLPPLNGFVSEFLIYSGAFFSFKDTSFTGAFIIISAVIALVLIGGLALFCFTKAFSIIFLGSPRSSHAHIKSDVSIGMIIPQVLIAFFIVLIGLFPFLFLPYIQSVIDVLTSQSGINFGDIDFSMLNNVSFVGGVLIFMFIVVYFIRDFMVNRRKVMYSPVWGCAYTGADPALHQYTATSFADNHLAVFKPVFDVEVRYEHFKEYEIFPHSRPFSYHATEIIEKKWINRPVAYLIHKLQRNVIFKNNQLSQYVLYALLFLIFIVFLTVFNFI